MKPQRFKMFLMVKLYKCLQIDRFPQNLEVISFRLKVKREEIAPFP